MLLINRKKKNGDEWETTLNNGLFAGPELEILNI